MPAVAATFALLLALAACADPAPQAVNERPAPSVGSVPTDVSRTDDQPTDTMAFDLADYQHSHRVLIVFSPSPNAPPATEQRGFLDGREEDLDVRDVLRVFVYETERGRAGDEHIAADDTRRLRDRFDIAAGTFRVVLIGRDGTVKETYDDPVSVDTLNAVIDAMPMGAREKREREQDS